MVERAEDKELDFGKCQSCDAWGPITDDSLCGECGEKIERDLIRMRDWDYVVTAFGLPPDKREELRQQVIEKYGEEFELIEE